MEDKKGTFGGFYKILQGDVMVELKKLPDNYADAIFSDPPLCDGVVDGIVKVKV